MRKRPRFPRKALSPCIPKRLHTGEWSEERYPKRDNQPRCASPRSERYEQPELWHLTPQSGSGILSHNAT